MAKVALITGASAGIGYATTEALAADGWSVVGASRRGSTGGSEGLIMDVDDDASVSEGVQGIVERHGSIDALITCAGWGVAGAAEVTPLEVAKAQFETNFWGSVRVVQAVLPGMRTRRAGHIVLVSSIGGALGLPFQAFYSASKFALEGFGEALAYEVAPFGIQVTLLQPGNVRTEFTERRQTLPADGYDPAQSKAIGVMERDEKNGVPPEKVAAAVRKALASRHPPRRMVVGRVSETIGVVAKRALPFRLFEAAAKGSLGV